MCGKKKAKQADSAEKGRGRGHRPKATERGVERVYASAVDERSAEGSGVLIAFAPGSRKRARSGALQASRPYTLKHLSLHWLAAMDSASAYTLPSQDDHRVEPESAKTSPISHTQSASGAASGSASPAITRIPPRLTEPGKKRSALSCVNCRRRKIRCKPGLVGRVRYWWGGG